MWWKWMACDAVGGRAWILNWILQTEEAHGIVTNYCGRALHGQLSRAVVLKLVHVSEWIDVFVDNAASQTHRTDSSLVWSGPRNLYFNKALK